MKKFIQKSLLIALLFLSYTAAAQTKAGTATGKVLNGKDKTPLDFASVAIKKLYGDSSVVGTATTTTAGTFSIANIPVGKYRLFVVYLGLKTINKDFELTSAAPGVNFGDLILEDTGVDLATVEIKGEIPPVVVKKDTLEFNASAFKVKENAVVEDVLKKLPGVDVDKNGTITSQGETIRRVRVDGKDFMGNDPLMATRNLPADMIDKIQIIDDLSDQSKFTGVDDGNREKIINITTRQDKKNGFFGNSNFGYGEDVEGDSRYDVSVNVNKFKNDEQMSIIGQFNNVNKQNFGGGGFGGGGRGQGGGGAQSQGITTTNMAGLNYANVYKNGTQFNASYNFSKTSLFLERNSFTQNLLGSTTTTNSSATSSTTDRLSHRLNFTLDAKIDSSISFRLRPDINLSQSDANNFENYDRRVLSTTTIGEQRFTTNSSGPSIGNNLLIRKKFQRRGRTMSLNINTNVNNSEAENLNFIQENVMVGTTPSVRVVNQQNDQNNRSINNNARLVYTEPLNKTLSLELNYTNGYSFDNQERLVYNFNPVTQRFDSIDPLFSNNFENTTFSNAVGFSFNKNEKKYNWNAGLGVQHLNQQRLDVTTNDNFKRDFINLTPSAQFRYNFSNSKRLIIRYDGRTQQPSIGQIQPILDNTNTQRILLGNPDLDQSFVNSFRIFYNSFDFASFRNFNAGAFLTHQFNGFGENQRLITDVNDPNYGKIATSYVNVDGNFSGSGWLSLSQPIIKNNKLSAQVDFRGNYQRSTGFTNSLENITNDYSITNGYRLISNLDKFDLIAGISGTLFRATYSANPRGNTKYYALAPNIDISYMFPGNFRLQTDVTYNKLTGRGEGFDTDFTMMNAYLSRQFFKNRGTFKFSVNDLLNQNTGITRTSNLNQIVDMNFNVLKRYYMLTFTYSLNRVAGRNVGGQMPGQGGGRTMMRGMGM
ncbi:MAG: hypothetical protein EOO90_14845 [Pedobacter sp.]|nr:MAG: hypothetical protein EOO90_14845 [Pedobacter sp.]